MEQRAAIEGTHDTAGGFKALLEGSVIHLSHLSFVPILEFKPNLSTTTPPNIDVIFKISSILKYFKASPYLCFDL